MIVLQYTLVQPGETLPINLLAIDQVGNSREAVWSLEAPAQEAVSHSTHNTVDSQYVLHVASSPGHSQLFNAMHSDKAKCV